MPPLYHNPYMTLDYHVLTYDAMLVIFVLPFVSLFFYVLNCHDVCFRTSEIDVTRGGLTLQITQIRFTFIYKEEP